LKGNLEENLEGNLQGNLEGYLDENLERNMKWNWEGNLYLHGNLHLPGNCRDSHCFKAGLKSKQEVENRFGNKQTNKEIGTYKCIIS